jgi:hypothetical protein
VVIADNVAYVYDRHGLTMPKLNHLECQRAYIVLTRDAPSFNLAPELTQSSNIKVVSIVCESWVARSTVDLKFDITFGTKTSSQIELVNYMNMFNATDIFHAGMNDLRASRCYYHKPKVEVSAYRQQVLSLVSNPEDITFQILDTNAVINVNSIMGQLLTMVVSRTPENPALQHLIPQKMLKNQCYVISIEEAKQWKKGFHETIQAHEELIPLSRLRVVANPVERDNNDDWSLSISLVMILTES